MQGPASVDEAIKILTDCGHQEELINYIKGISNKEGQDKIAAQVCKLAITTPTGLKNYLSRGRDLLEASRKGDNPFSSMKPEVPEGVFLKPGEAAMDKYEAAGIKELAKTGFVLIAGGLGERLGYSGIKIDLPVCTIEKDYCYLKYYTQYAHACHKRALPFVPEAERANFYIPFCIMVSDDTHDRTVALLQKYNYFGMDKDKIDIIKQENVPALIDNTAKIAFKPEEFKVVTKPHGHGDVHNLLFDSGVAKKWRDMGKEWMVFIQDTNALAMKAVPSILGVSKENNWQMNTVCVPRMPGESMGAICRLKDEKDPSKELVINVEYNQLDSLLKAKWNKDGDIKNEMGYSHFPGNTNTLVFKIPEYFDNLSKTGGVIPEFVNPKYANDAKTVFKSPTRLECMMQDYPKLLTGTGQVGFTMYETWYCFSPAKNNIVDAAKCVEKGIPSYGAAEAEYNFFNWTNKMLKIAGVAVEQEETKTDFNGMAFAFGPKILLDPTFAITFQELKEKMKGNNKISKNASLVLYDHNEEVKNLDLGMSTTIFSGNKMSVAPQCVFEKSDDADEEVYRIRGYKPTYACKERTYIMIKPDGVQRGLVGAIMTRFEEKGFKLVAMKLAQPGKEMFQKHYADLAGKSFFNGLVDYAASGPVCCMVWEGDDAVLTGRKMLGATKPFDSAPGTIRGDYCIDVGRNVIHGSDAVESANKEIALWFKKDELLDWVDHSEEWIYE